MPCQERERLEKEHAEAGTAFDGADEGLQAKVGISSRSEYQRLQQAVEVAWGHLTSARGALDRHIREHGCERANGASANL